MTKSVALITGVTGQMALTSPNSFCAKARWCTASVNPRYFRPTEVECLVGDPSKAQRKLGWKHRVSFDALVSEMVDEDLKLLRAESQRRNPHE